MRGQIYTIEDIMAVIIPVAREYGVKQMTLFGSYARGDATAKSDIDFHLIDTVDLWGYVKLCGFRQELEDRLGVGVDVLTSGAMDNDVLEMVRRDEVLIFEQ